MVINTKYLFGASSYSTKPYSETSMAPDTAVGSRCLLYIANHWVGDIIGSPDILLQSQLPTLLTWLISKPFFTSRNHPH